LNDVVQGCIAQSAIAGLSVIPLVSSFGVMQADAKGRAISFEEKPQLPYWINIGYGFLGREAVDLLPSENSMKEFLERLVRTGRLSLNFHQGLHVTFNTLTEKEEAEHAIRDFGI
jgi:NDP-sugar pyrophosphorylase family protein